MGQISQVEKIIDLLKEHARQPFTARQIAEAIVKQYPEDYREKRQNPRFNSKKDFLAQVTAEIGAQKLSLLQKDSHILWRDKPRPRVYWYDPQAVNPESSNGDGSTINDESTLSDLDPSNGELTNNDIDQAANEIPRISQTQGHREEELYPILINYLKTEKKLYCQRIDDKRSRNQGGRGSNHWLHPDIVAMQPLDRGWDSLIKPCTDNRSRVRLWSFEVKKKLNTANVRESFFQAVSNSSWANEGYLVSAEISENIEEELKMLSSLHGIGVILLNSDNPSESEIIFPAHTRIEVDWQSVNRILKENSDFKEYIELVSNYYQTGLLRSRDWNRV